jgi:hypothetical protein
VVRGACTSQCALTKRTIIRLAATGRWLNGDISPAGARPRGGRGAARAGGAVSEHALLQRATSRPHHLHCVDASTTREPLFARLRAPPGVHNTCRLSLARRHA